MLGLSVFRTWYLNKIVAVLQIPQIFYKIGFYFYNVFLKQMKYNNNVTDYDTVHILPEKALIYPKLLKLSPFFFAFFPYAYSG